MKKMKRSTFNTILSVVVLAAVAVSGYFIFVGSKDKTDYTYYENAIAELANAEFDNQFDHCDGEAILSLKDGKYVVRVVLANATTDLIDIDLLAIDSRHILSSNTIYPSLGLIDNYHYNLVINKDGKEENQTSYVLSFESEEAVTEVCVYLAYTLEDQRIYEFVEMETIIK